MPRRLLGIFYRSNGPGRLVQALEGDQEKPNIEEIIESQDLKLQEVKRNVFSGVSMPVKLIAEAPLLSAEIPTPAISISTHYNDEKQRAILEAGHFNKVGEDYSQNGGVMSEADIDFSKAENLFLLEAPIDAKKDHNMLKLAHDVPKGTFMWRLLRRYPMNRKRLAFIQRHSNQIKSLEVVGNVIVSAKGGDGKEITITCQICGQKFGHQHQFQRHILMHPDPENKKFLCQICGKRFNRADHLNRHAVLHVEVKVQKCLLCGEEFDRSSHLDRHRRKHHPPAGQQPSQTPPLTPSMKSPPSGMSLAGPFNGFSTEYAASPSLMDQQSSGHNLHLLAAVATPEGQTSPSQYPHHAPHHLPQDDSYMTDEDEQVLLDMQHQHPPEQVAIPRQQEEEANIPEPERPYPCEVCGRKFIRATHLRRHMRIHTGEKPFACHICGRRYARGDYLRAHIHAHRRDKIHKCKHCGEVFHDLTRFADHCRLLHKDMDDQFGNPKQPPESSPPPPPLSALLESSLAAEIPDEITIVPSMHMTDMSLSSSSVPITLVTLPNPSGDQEMEANRPMPPPPPSFNLPSQSSIMPMSYAFSSPGVVHISSAEPQFSQLSQVSAPRLSSNAPTLIPNGQVHLSDITRQEGGGVFGRAPIKSAAFHELYAHDSHMKATPISYVDNVAQYMYASNSHDGNGSGFPPHSSPLVSHNHPH